MGTLALSEALAGALAHVTMPQERRKGLAMARRNAVPVRRGSVEAGTFEQHFFTLPAKGETDRYLRAARRMLDAGRQLRSEARRDGRTLTPAEQRFTTLTAASIRVFEEILTLARLNKGRVFPSYDYLAQATSLGRATVARALRTLENVGFLLRQRRFKRVQCDGPGPRYAQTSNVYRPLLPAIVQAYLPRWMRPAPVPDDVVHRETERIAQQQAMLESMPHHEQASVKADDALASILARMSATLDRQERESHKDTPTLEDIFIKASAADIPVDISDSKHDKAIISIAEAPSPEGREDTGATQLERFPR